MPCSDDLGYIIVYDSIVNYFSAIVNRLSTISANYTKNLCAVEVLYTGRYTWGGVVVVRPPFPTDRQTGYLKRGFAP